MSLLGAMSGISEQGHCSTFAGFFGSTPVRFYAGVLLAPEVSLAVGIKSGNFIYCC
jgi:hypothetical protein